MPGAVAIPRVRVFRSSEGFTILVGKDAWSNERLSFHLAEAEDFWFHVAGAEGSHVVVRRPDRLGRLGRATLREAAALAAYYSKARGGGSVSVHHTTCRHVQKRRGLPEGTVELSRFESVRVKAAIPATVVSIESHAITKG